uniref:FYVE-type domain-containing protein n=1 Tax=Globisporangium ultimum (strain ATCC 200006 / CBS 805.95 / DAOM BR144) TaxID=431595 RepID=K3W6C3_GLOUD
MKFPLPANTFPRIHLSEDDMRALEGLSNFFVRETMDHYAEHRFVNNGVVDTTRWKKMKQREDVRVYRESTQTANTRATQSSTSMIDDARFIDQSSMAMPVLLTVGTLNGTLEDVMYGYSTPTQDAMKVKTAYVGDGFVDWANLASIIKPTPEDPFRELSIRWTVKSHPHYVGVVMRVRDLLYLESIGITKTKDGERIGYCFQHSIEIPEIRELHELNIVRGKVSFCHLFRQKSENTVELYVRGLIRPMGDATASITAISGTEFCISIWKNMHCAQMKKLAWLVRTNSAQERATLQPTTSCVVCSKAFKTGSFLSSKGKTCRLCLGPVCSSCRVTMPLCFTTELLQEVIQKKITFCTTCVQRARRTSARHVATSEMLEADRKYLPGVVGGSSMFMSDSSSSLSSPSSHVSR